VAGFGRKILFLDLMLRVHLQIPRNTKNINDVFDWLVSGISSSEIRLQPHPYGRRRL